MIGTGIGMLIAGLAAAGGTIAASKIGSGAAKRAGEFEAAGADKQLAYLKTKDLEDQRNWETTRDDNRRMFDQTERSNYDQWAFREGNLAPYRAIGTGATATLAHLMGTPFDPGAFAPPAYRGSSAPSSAPAATADPKVAAFIQDWQASHPVSEGIGPLATAIAQQFPTVSRHMYGQTPSNNELSIGGQPYKVLGGEGGPGAYWYKPGTDDSAPGAMPGAAARAVMPAPTYGAPPATLRTLMNPTLTPTLAGAPPRAALTFRDLMARLPV